jgi:hypothetical protein
MVQHKRKDMNLCNAVYICLIIFFFSQVKNKAHHGYQNHAYILEHIAVANKYIHKFETNCKGIQIPSQGPLGS